MQTVFKKFGKDEQGAVAMTFGLMTLVLLFLCGMAMDYSRAMNVRSRVSDAADSAALVAGRALMEGKLSVAEIEQMAAKYFQQNIKGLGTTASIDNPTIKVDAQTGAVNVNVSSHVPMTLTKVAGFQTLDFPISTTAIFKQRDIEIGMALDITGSMGDPSFDGKRKIDGLKKAFETFANRLLPDRQSDLQKVRIGIAPYSYSINLGTVAASISNPNATTCVSERKGGSYSDEYGPFFAIPAGNCVGTKIVPMTDDRDNLVAKVKAFNPGGSTAGHLGVQWAWNLVSPKWGSTWGGNSVPASMDQVENGKLLKAVVLMTDGIFNTQYHGPSSKKQAIALCDAMKAEGIVVFSVVFNGPREAADTDTLKQCATPGNGYFANASSTEELENAFENFASKLTELRLTK